MKEEGRNEDTMYGCGFCTCAIAQFELHVIAIVFQVLFLYMAPHEEVLLLSESSCADLRSMKQ